MNLNQIYDQDMRSYQLRVGLYESRTTEDTIDETWLTVDAPSKKVPKYKPEGGFAMVAQVALKEIVKLDATRAQLRVLMYLISEIEWENRVARTQTQIAQELEMSRTEVSRCVRYLCEHGIIKKHREPGREAVYEFSTRYVVKGMQAIVRANNRQDFVPPPPRKSP